jgi:polysaccharide biosynthesis/export protein
MYTPISGQNVLPSSGFSQQLKRSATGLAVATLTLVTAAAPSIAQVQTLPRPQANTSTPGLPLPLQPGSPNPALPNRPGFAPNSGVIEQFDAESYILGPGDVVVVEVFNQPDLSKPYRILNDGTVSLPMVGNIMVRGLTLRQASSAISTKYLKYFKRPNVTVRLEGNRPITIGIAGQVFRPGTYILGNDGSNTTTTVQTTRVPKVSFAVQTAGGVSPRADLRNVQVRRPQAGRPDMLINVDLWRMIDQGDLSQDVMLRDGDSIIIPEATAALTPAEQTRLAMTTLAPATINVNVVGEVRVPGLKQLTPNTPFNNAIMAAGGLTPTRGNVKNVTLIRLNMDGTVTQQVIAFNPALGINAEGNPTLQNNDVIVVNRTGLARFNDNFNQLFSPFTGITNSITRFIPGIP